MLLKLACQVYGKSGKIPKLCLFSLLNIYIFTKPKKSFKSFVLFEEIQSLHPELIAFVNIYVFSLLKPVSLFTWKNYYEALNFKEEGDGNLFLFSPCRLLRNALCKNKGTHRHN